MDVWLKLIVVWPSVALFQTMEEFVVKPCKRKKMAQLLPHQVMVLLVGVLLPRALHLEGYSYVLNN